MCEASVHLEARIQAMALRRLSAKSSGSLPILSHESSSA